MRTKHLGVTRGMTALAVDDTAGISMMYKIRVVVCTMFMVRAKFELERAIYPAILCCKNKKIYNASLNAYTIDDLDYIVFFFV
jgi:hypothetical protein